MGLHASSREQQRQALDAEIKSSESSIKALDLKHRRNALAHFSSLPSELIAAIFSYLPLTSPDTSPLSTLPTQLVAKIFPALRGILSLPGHRPTASDWLCAAHVCHQWREIALNDPLFWNHVDFTDLTPAGAAEMLARAKKMPLYFEAWDTRRFWANAARRGAFENELQARISHISHLRIRAEDVHLRSLFDRLASPAPTLEYLTLSQDSTLHFHSNWSSLSVPDTLFDGTAPRLSRLELRNLDISWNSPLLKGLRHLEIRELSDDARPSLAVWLDALDEMTSLESLVLHSASPFALPFPSDIERAVVTLPSLTHLDISASAWDCALALAHLTLPALTQLFLTAESSHVGGDDSDVQNLIPYIAQHAGGPQDAQPLQSAFMYRKRRVTTVLAWPVPGMDIGVDLYEPFAVVMAPSARVAVFIISNTRVPTRDRDDLLSTVLLNTLMMGLPLDSLVTLSVHHDIFLDTQFWLRHVPKWSLLRRMQLTPPEARGFTEMLLQDNGYKYPLLPSLIELVLVDVVLSVQRTLHLCDALMARVEQGVPLETLDLCQCACEATSDAVDLLREIVVDVWEPIVSSVRIRGKPFVHDDSSGEENYSDDHYYDYYDVEERQESEDYYPDTDEDYY